MKVLIGMIAGVVGGCLCGITAWLAFASKYEGGLAPQYFVNNTGKVGILNMYSFYGVLSTLGGSCITGPV